MPKIAVVPWHWRTSTFLDKSYSIILTSTVICDLFYMKDFKHKIMPKSYLDFLTLICMDSCPACHCTSLSFQNKNLYLLSKINVFKLNSFYRIKWHMS